MVFEAGFEGKHHSEESKRKISDSLKKNYKEHPENRKKRSHTPWSKGKTKETDEKLKLQSEKLSKTVKEQYKNGRQNPMKGQKRPDLIAYNKKAKELGLRKGPLNGMYGKLRPDIWKAHVGLGKVAKKGTFIENIFSKFLDLSNINYQRQYPIFYDENDRRKVKIVDFIIPNLKKIVECDGKYWHQDKDKDDKRDKIILDVLGNGWIIEHLTSDEIYDIGRFMNIKTY